MELKIDSEKVQKAAERCPTAKEVLKTLFPEAFTEKIDPGIRQGDIFEINSNSYLLATVADGRRMALIMIGGYNRYDIGNRWAEPITIEDPLNITYEEFSKMVRKSSPEVSRILDTQIRRKI